MVRQLMTESLLVCFAGGALGLLVAWWAVGAFVAGLPAAGNFRMPRHQEIAMGAPVIAFNFAVCLATGLLFGLMPALRASRTHLFGRSRRRAGPRRTVRDCVSGACSWCRRLRWP